MPDHLLLGPGVFVREVDEYLVAEKPGMRVRVRDRASIDILRRAAAATAGARTSPNDYAGSAEGAGGVAADGVIAALLERGFLTPGHGSAQATRSDRTNDYLVSLHGRYTADLVEGARQRLRAARVALVGDSWLGRRVRRVLADSGVGMLSVSETPAPLAEQRLASRSPSELSADLLVNLAWSAPGTAEGNAIDGMPVLPAVWNHDEIVVGPVLGGTAGRCRVCCGPSPRGRGWRDAPRADRFLGVGLVSAAVLSYLSGLNPCDVLTMAVRYDLRTRQSESVPPRGDISCPRCGVPDLGAGEPPHPTAQLAWSYEESVDIPVTRASGTERWLSVRSQSVFRRRHYHMPPVRRLAEDRGVPVPRQAMSLLDLTMKADLVTKQGKVTGIRYRRLPTVEGIGTSSVYLLPQEEHSLLRGGAYYDPYDGELIPLAWPADVADWPMTRFSLCVTGNFAGAEVCFGRFGRKVVLQDAGFLLAQLLHDGSRLGLRPVLSSSWSANHARSVLDLAAGEEALAVIDYHVAAGEEVVPDPAARPGSCGAGSPPANPGTDSWLRVALDEVRRAASPLLSELVLHCWSADAELREIQLEEGAYVGQVPLQPAVAGGDALRDYLTRHAATNGVTFLIGADLRAAVHRSGATAYSSLVQRAVALAHYLTLLADETQLASRVMLKIPARLVERSIAGGGSRHRVLSAVSITTPPGSQVR